MLNTPLYQPPNPADWQGRQDTSAYPQYLYQTVQFLDLSHQIEPQLPGIAVIGFNCDLGVKRNQGRIGAANGPQAIKAALASLPAHQKIHLYDAGYIIPQKHDLAEAQTALAAAIQLLLTQGLFPIVLGGGHETAWGHYQGIAAYLKNTPISILNFDAHFDLRDLPADGIGTSGTAFKQIAQLRAQQQLNFDYYCLGIQKTANSPALFVAAAEHHTHYLLAETIYRDGPQAVENFLSPILRKDNPIYLTLCLDVFAASYAPAVSAPQVLGLTPWQIIPGLKQLALSGKVISMDIVELAPNYDQEQHTAKLAAQLLAMFLYPQDE